MSAPRSRPSATRLLGFGLPLALFAALAFMLARGLQHGHSEALPSPLIGRALPAFVLPQLEIGRAHV